MKFRLGEKNQPIKIQPIRTNTSRKYKKIKTVLTANAVNDVCALFRLIST